MIANFLSYSCCKAYVSTQTSREDLTHNWFPEKEKYTSSRQNNEIKWTKKDGYKIPNLFK